MYDVCMYVCACSRGETFRVKTTTGMNRQVASRSLFHQAYKDLCVHIRVVCMYVCTYVGIRTHTHTRIFSHLCKQVLVLNFTALSHHDLCGSTTSPTPTVIICSVAPAVKPCAAVHGVMMFQLLLRLLLLLLLLVRVKVVSMTIMMTTSSMAKTAGATTMAVMMTREPPW